MSGKISTYHQFTIARKMYLYFVLVNALHLFNLINFKFTFF